MNLPRRVSVATGNEGIILRLFTCVKGSYSLT